MRIGICDDEKNIRAHIRKLIREQGGEHSIIEFASGEELLAVGENVKVAQSTTGACSGEKGIFADARELDLLFLDIAMGDMDGMEAARQFRQSQAQMGLGAWGSLPLIVFVTGFSGYMPEAFSVNAFQFLEKPIDEAAFAKVFEQAKRECSAIREKERREEKRITVEFGGNSQSVSVKNILYIESVGHKNVICLRGERLEYYGRIGDLEEELAPDFFRIHRGYLINLDCVDHYDRTGVWMENGDCLALSRYKYQEFVRRYLQYIS